MRSGNGRHRRPRQVPAIVVTAGVAGSALALPLLAATNASAADAATWDKVAECESGGTWSANAGTGAYGGLQFSQEEWKNAGGLAYAERADLASRSQQIAVAERVLASQGPQVWSLCAAPAGLSGEGAAAQVDPGDVGAPGPVAPSPSRPDHTVPVHGSTPATDYGAPTPSPNPSGSPSFGLPDVPLGPSLGLPVMPDPDLPSTTPTTPGGPTTGPTAPTTPADPSAPAVPTDPGASPADPADPSAPATPGATPGPGASPSPSATADAAAAAADAGGGKHRGTPAVEASLTSDAASDPTYTVKAGDSLAAIADAKGVTGGWNALYQANEQVIGGDADLIKPGQNLDLSKK
ncbi:transglycosylase family protein [Streptomyces sp. APSN-46.1]|uniref:LysM peptidoglycan-binding domain-containing protein n=1 Tax=Streptomyces sp. APSN-46.1 TaxID=2929049 RepID=UPI001FB2BAFE|nr:transglycosylase family protein [Streptomyces sp. APSN-46.1]MCJ1678948.1 transglycosylase family protein [Streptomyces sp. APSN-46.1]